MILLLFVDCSVFLVLLLCCYCFMVLFFELLFWTLFPPRPSPERFTHLLKLMIWISHLTHSVHWICRLWLVRNCLTSAQPPSRPLHLGQIWTGFPMRFPWVGCPPWYHEVQKSGILQSLDLFLWKLETKTPVEHLIAKYSKIHRIWILGTSCNTRNDGW